MPDPAAPSLLDLLPDPILHIDGDGVLVGVHGDASAALGQDVAPGLALAEVASNGGRALERAIAPADAGRRVEWVTLVDGRMRVWEARLVDGPAAGHRLAVLRDATPRRASEILLAADKERLLVTLRSIQEGVISTDREGRIVLMNPAAERYLGIEAGEARGTTLRDLLSGQGVYQSAVGAAMARLEVVRGERVVHLHMGTHPVLQHGQLLGAVYTLRDVTDEDRAEAERLRASRLESVGLMAKGIAHDFNNLLASITGNVAYLREVYDADDDVLGVLDDLDVASGRAVALTRQLLSFSSGGGTPLTRAGDVARILSDAAEAGTRGSAVKANVAAPDGLHPVDVDPAQVHQALQSLVINACQAMPGGGQVELLAENLVALPSRLGGAVGPWVHIAVSDEGVGIPEADLPRIFDPYFTTRPGGTGLGLATASAVVRRHGGHLTVDSYVGRGSTFDVYLPARTDPVADPTPSTLPRLSGRVLVVDDEPVVRTVAERLCRLMGLEVESVADGDAATSVVRSARREGRAFDVVLLDLTIPGGAGGLEVVRDLGELEPDLPVVAVSGYSTGPVMEQPRRFGFHAALAKPFDAKQLGSVIARLLPSPGGEPAPS